MQKFTLDATNKRPGRLATEVAVLLMGKNRVDFARNAIPSVLVEVTNTSKMQFTEKKLIQKLYATHSGYPGKLKLKSQSNVVEKRGSKEVLRKAISGMLPKNKLRPRMLKNLKITE